MTEKFELFIDGEKRFECQQEKKITRVFVKLNGKAITKIIVIPHD